MLLKFKEVDCIGMNVTYTSFAIRSNDIKKIIQGGIITLTGEEYTTIIVKSYEEESYTTTHKVLGNFNKNFNRIYRVSK